MNSFISFMLLSSAIIACNPPQKGLQGKWNSLKSKGFTAYLRGDGTFDAFIDGKSFSSGYYKTSGDTIIVHEPNPDSYPAIYTFQLAGDNVTWHVVSDTLTGRREAMDGHAFERITD